MIYEESSFSKNYGNEQIFTHLLNTHYSSPKGFSFETSSRYYTPIINKEAPETTNVINKVYQHISTLKNTYKTTNNLFVLFGEDFTSENAFSLYENLDNLIDLMNENPAYNKTYVLKYSTPGDYIKSLKKYQKLALQ